MGLPYPRLVRPWSCWGEMGENLSSPGPPRQSWEWPQTKEAGTLLLCRVAFCAGWLRTALKRIGNGQEKVLLAGSLSEACSWWAASGRPCPKHDAFYKAAPQTPCSQPSKARHPLGPNCWASPGSLHSCCCLGLQRALTGKALPGEPRAQWWSGADAPARTGGPSGKQAFRCWACVELLVVVGYV